MLKINKLQVKTDDRVILDGLDLCVKKGEVHAIMGPNGAGKSTLSMTLAGREGYQVTSGTVDWNGRDLLSLSPEERASSGVFLAFQYPVEIPGVSTLTFLKTALGALRRSRGMPEGDAITLLRLIKAKAAELGIKEDMLKRSLNVGFSGGEKKRNEVLQMAVLEPELCILDETDSGLDVDALRVVAEGVNALRSPDRAFVLITHYQRLLDYIKPDYVHILYKGRIVRSGGPDLAREIETNGYAGIIPDANAAKPKVSGVSS